MSNIKGFMEFLCQIQAPCNQQAHFAPIYVLAVQPTESVTPPLDLVAGDEERTDFQPCTFREANLLSEHALSRWLHRTPPAQHFRRETAPEVAQIRSLAALSLLTRGPEAVLSSCSQIALTTADREIGQRLGRVQSIDTESGL